MTASRPPLWLRKICSHGKLLEEDCLACAMMWRIEQRKDAEIVRLRARVQELEGRMPDEATLSLEPVGTDRFEIVLRPPSGVIKARLRGPNNHGYTEADLRDAQGLPKIGLSEERIEQEIAAANARRSQAP